jgi:hypothetical protein
MFCLHFLPANIKIKIDVRKAEGKNNLRSQSADGGIISKCIIKK